VSTSPTHSVGGVIIHSSLAHAVAELPNFLAKLLLGWKYPEGRLSSNVRFACVQTGATIHISMHEFTLLLQVTNLLPFDVVIKHLEFEVKLERDTRLASIYYSRSITVKHGSIQEIKLPMFQLSGYQVSLAKKINKSLWVFGSGDLETNYGVAFPVKFVELNCAPLVIGNF